MAFKFNASSAMVDVHDTPVSLPEISNYQSPDWSDKAWQNGHEFMIEDNEGYQLHGGRATTQNNEPLDYYDKIYPGHDACFIYWLVRGTWVLLDPDQRIYGAVIHW